MSFVALSVRAVGHAPPCFLGQDQRHGDERMAVGRALWLPAKFFFPPMRAAVPPLQVVVSDCIS